MSNGGLIGKRLIPTKDAAKGTWGINESYNARLDDIWPIHGVVLVNTDFLIIAGGGGGGAVGTPSGNDYPSAQSGGGAGGYLNSYGSESSGGNSASLSSLSLGSELLYSVTIGAGGAIATNGSNTSFSGTAFNDASISLVAIGGGAGGDYGATSTGGGSDGGSGGGGGHKLYTQSYSSSEWSPGSGTSNQGFGGGTHYMTRDTSVQSFCDAFGGSWCRVQLLRGGGGGGAGGVGATSTPGNGQGGAGLASSITGTSVMRAVGGSGRGTHGSVSGSMPTGSGSSSHGGGGLGGSTTNTGGDGVVILRYPSGFTLNNPDGNLTITHTTTGSDRVSSITAGSGNIKLVNA